MAERSIPERVIFPKPGNQRAFLVRVKKFGDYSWNDLGTLVGVSDRTVRDWVREKHRISYYAVTHFSILIGKPVPKNIKILTWAEHLHSISGLGGHAKMKKYGRVVVEEMYRQQKWREWWEKKGKHESHPIINQPKSIKKPRFSQRLAEFVGILLGDGGITPAQVIVTLHRFDDAEYSAYIRKLIHDLFGVKPSLSPQKYALADDIVTSRVALVRFCTNTLGLKIGNKVKQQVDVPAWIMNNPMYRIACLRGLIDTDGCIFTHRYTVKGKEYRYKKIEFTNQSVPLRLAAYRILQSLGLNPRLAGNKDVRIDAQENVKKYFEIVGSHNPKHLKRYVS